MRNCRTELTLIGSSEMELKVGQRWRTRGGYPATVEAPNDGREFDVGTYPWAVRLWPMGTDMGSHVVTVTAEGRVFRADSEHSDDLMDLVEDVPVNAPLEFPKWPVSSVEEQIAAAAVVRRDWDRPGYDSNPGTAINPKDAIGAQKLPLHLWPSEATAMGCLGMLEGMLKYGRNNYIAGEGVIASIYVDAAIRHLLAWFAGEENAHDTGTPHLANALATIAIVVKCRAHARLIDDRDYATLPNGERYRALIEELTPHVKRLQVMFADKSPRHFTHPDINVERKKADDTEGGAL